MSSTEGASPAADPDTPRSANEKNCEASAAEQSAAETSITVPTPRASRPARDKAILALERNDDSDVPKITSPNPKAAPSSRKRTGPELDDELNDDVNAPDFKKARGGKREAPKSSKPKAGRNQARETSPWDDLDTFIEPEHASPPAAKQSVKKRTTAPRKKKIKAPISSLKGSRAQSSRANKKWEPHSVVTSMKSPLVNVSLTRLFSNPKAWSCLTRPQQEELLADLPPDPNLKFRSADEAFISPKSATPTLPLLRFQRSEQFKSDARTFQDDLRNGRLEPSWMEAAMNASRRRESGEFDDWKSTQREVLWGMNLGVDGEEAEAVIEEMNTPTAKTTANKRPAKRKQR